MVVKKSMALTKVYWSIVKRSIKLILVGLILNSRGNGELALLCPICLEILTEFTLSWLTILAHPGSFAKIWPDILVCGHCSHVVVKFQQRPTLSYESYFDALVFKNYIFVVVRYELSFGHIAILAWLDSSWNYDDTLLFTNLWMEVWSKLSSRLLGYVLWASIDEALIILF